MAKMIHPERHRSLTIRVAGYTAYFVDIAGKLQVKLLREQPMITSKYLDI